MTYMSQATQTAEHFLRKVNESSAHAPKVEKLCCARDRDQQNYDLHLNYIRFRDRSSSKHEPFKSCRRT